MPLRMPHPKSRPHLAWGFYFDQLSDDLLLRKGKPLRKKHHHAQSNIGCTAIGSSRFPVASNIVASKSPIGVVCPAPATP